MHPSRRELVAVACSQPTCEAACSLAVLVSPALPPLLEVQLAALSHRRTLRIPVMIPITDGRFQLFPVLRGTTCKQWATGVGRVVAEQSNGRRRHRLHTVPLSPHRTPVLSAHQPHVHQMLLSFQAKHGVDLHIILPTFSIGNSAILVESIRQMSLRNENSATFDVSENVIKTN
jgi:hypothetical protein